LGINSDSDTTQNTCEIDLKIEIKDVNRLAQLISKLRKIRSVTDVYKTS
jgi:(p)ppGpp synthase/HD superfamily hydrolase